MAVYILQYLISPLLSVQINSKRNQATVSNA